MRAFSSDVSPIPTPSEYLSKARSADFGKVDGSYNNIIYPENSYLNPSIYPSQSIAVRQRTTLADAECAAMFTFLSTFPRKEDDKIPPQCVTTETDFYPRPPQGGRHLAREAAAYAAIIFLSTSPARRTMANMTKNTRRFPSIFVG